MLLQFPPSQTCLCLILYSPLFFSDHLTAVAFQNVFGNVNMLANRYRICPLMHVTMGDPTWAFVLVATEIWSSHSVTSRVSHFKNSPVFFTTAFCGNMHAHGCTRTQLRLQTSTRLHSHKHTMIIIEHFKRSQRIAFILVITTF